jgi:hypothetical protein
MLSFAIGTESRHPLHSSSHCLLRIVPVESGSGVSRNQAYNMVSVYGDVVLVEPAGNADSSSTTDVIEKLQITIPLTLQK